MVTEGKHRTGLGVGLTNGHGALLSGLYLGAEPLAPCVGICQYSHSTGPLLRVVAQVRGQPRLQVSAVNFLFTCSASREGDLV